MPLEIRLEEVNPGIPRQKAAPKAWLSSHVDDREHAAARFRDANSQIHYAPYFEACSPTPPGSTPRSHYPPKPNECQSAFFGLSHVKSNFEIDPLFFRHVGQLPAHVRIAVSQRVFKCVADLAGIE